MDKPKQHIFVCASFRAQGAPQGICHKKESLSLIPYFESELADRGMSDVAVSATACLNLCEKGPIVVIYLKTSGTERSTAKRKLMKSLMHLKKVKPAKRTSSTDYYCLRCLFMMERQHFSQHSLYSVKHNARRRIRKRRAPTAGAIRYNLKHITNTPMKPLTILLVGSALLAPAHESAQAADSGSTGRELYRRHCSSCHSMTPPPETAPPIVGLAHFYHKAFDSREPASAISWTSSPTPNQRSRSSAPRLSRGSG